MVIFPCPFSLHDILTLVLNISEDEQIDEFYEADVVVVGAGSAGVVAALSAAEQGASVPHRDTTILEGQLNLGGKT